jgi:kynureninase
LNDLKQTARNLDRADPLAGFRDRFHIPRLADGSEQTYFCGHSLGLQPRNTASVLEEELDRWRKLAVRGHFEGDPSWMGYTPDLAASIAEIVGAKAGEIAIMNSLTVNLHLMMVSFYRPSGRRRKILIEKASFPSDRYAVESQIRLRGLDPDECLVELAPLAGNRLIDEEQVEDLLERHGEDIALVLWPGVQYATGQSFDLGRIAAAARRAGARIGFDLAHAVGNVPLSIRESGCDFAAWCHYKYLNAGPGAVGGAFVHERHHGSGSLDRLHGWWGNDESNRFEMARTFTPEPDANAWQLSTPLLFSMAPLRPALALFREAGMDRLRAKSKKMTAYLEAGIRSELDGVLEIITPDDPERRGCQLSLRVRGGRGAGRELFGSLENEGFVPDWREPDVIRIAPAPLYNRFEECYRFIEAVDRWSAVTRTLSGGSV